MLTVLTKPWADTFSTRRAAAPRRRVEACMFAFSVELLLLCLEVIVVGCGFGFTALPLLLIDVLFYYTKS